MPRAPIADNESARLEALRRYGVLDTPANETFGRLTRLTSSLLGAPIALITLVDESRQWCLAGVGLDVGSIPRRYHRSAWGYRPRRKRRIPSLRNNGDLGGAPRRIDLAVR